MPMERSVSDNVGSWKDEVDNLQVVMIVSSSQGRKERAAGEFVERNVVVNLT